MHPKQIESVIALSPNERYGYFVRKVADCEELWGLYDDGWAMMADGGGQEVFPLWPEREFADLMITDLWASHSARKIDLESFLARWIAGMTQDGIRPAVFPTPKGLGVVVDPSRLAEDLKEELEQYE